MALHPEYLKLFLLRRFLYKRQRGWESLEPNKSIEILLINLPRFARELDAVALHKEAAVVTGKSPDEIGRHL